MYTYDATKAEKFFIKMEKRNPKFDYRTAFHALFEITGKLNEYEKAKESNLFYSFFQFDSPSVLIGPSDRAKRMVLNNVLNIYTKIIDKNDYEQAISTAKTQIGESAIDAMIFSKKFKHYEFALKYLIENSYKSDLKNKKETSNNNYLKELQATKAAEYSCNEIEKIITEKQKTQTF